jgi:PAS domain S-box-containing protein
MSHLSISESDTVPKHSDTPAGNGQMPAFGNQMGIHDILEALPEAVYTTDATGRIAFYNKAAVEMWGVSPEIGTSEFCGSWKLYWPDGTPLLHDECTMAMAVKEKQAIRGLEAIAERPDGTRVPFLPFPTPIFNAEGDLIGAVSPE